MQMHQRRRRRLVAGMLVAVLGGLGGCRDDDGGVAVASLTFSGNTAFDDSQLRKVIVTEQEGILPWAKSRYFDRQIFDADLERLRRFYADRGYPEASIPGVDVSFNDARDAVRIDIAIDEGPPLVVSDVRFEGLDDVDPGLAARVRDIALVAGAPLDRQVLAASVENATFQLRDRGYPDARVTPREEAGDQPNTSIVTLAVEPGALSAFGDLSVVFGASRQSHVSTTVVERTVTFRPGDLFRQSQVLDSQRRLALLGVFDFAHVAPAGDSDGPASGASTPATAQTAAGAEGEGAAGGPTSPRLVPMVATVSEGRPTRLRFGLGYGSEDGPRGSLDWQHSNIFGGAQRLSVEGKYSLRLADATVRLVQPYLFARNVSLQGRLGATEVREPNYRSRRLGGAIIAEYRARDSRGLDRWPIEHVLRATYTNEALRYRIDQDTLADLSQFDELIALGFDPVTGEGSGRIGSLAIDAERSAVDDPIDPRSGYRFTLHLEQASTRLGGTYDYREVRAGADGYVPVGPAVVAARVRTGFLLADQALDVPFSQRYFLGGSSSLRGWGRFQVAPLTADGLPIGGRAMFETSTELRFPLRGSFGAALFVDAGNVWEDRSSLRLDDLRVAAGPGLRYQSPVGVVRADLGYQLTPIDGLIINGEPQRRRWRIHLSIGQAF